MKWFCVSIDTNKEGIEPLSDLLIDCDTGGVEIEDEAEFFKYIKEKSPFWDYVDEELEKSFKGVNRVKFYYPDNDGGLKIFETAKLAINKMAETSGGQYGELNLTVSDLQEEDFENAWKKYFKPFPVGNKLYILPEWESPKDHGERVILKINPGMSFGSGSHITTRLCLEILENHVSKGDRLLDLGCGSGILSIAALLLGANFAVGVDIDPVSPKTVLENARLNDIFSERLQVHAGNILCDTEICEKLGTGYDIVVANIVADVILSILQIDVKRYLKIGGLFIVSGIIDDREAEVVSSLKNNGFIIEDIKREMGWCAITARDSREN